MPVSNINRAASVIGAIWSTGKLGKTGRVEVRVWNTVVKWGGKVDESYLIAKGSHPNKCNPAKNDIKEEIIALQDY